MARSLRCHGAARDRTRDHVAEFWVEALEPRVLMFAWTAQEVYLAELVNRARADPVAEGQRLGLDLAAGLNSAELARLVAQEPLALNPSLTLAARAHSLDMATNNYFSHTSLNGMSPTQRAQAQGYGGTAGENIAAGYTSIDALHRAWLESVGHRRNVLSLHASFDADFHYDELGVGLAFNAGGAYQHYFTQNFGYQGANPVRYILGVVYDDTNGNNFYTVGEGAANIRVDVLSGQTVIGTYTTDAAGNYQIVAPAGTYTVRFTSLATNNTFEQSATVTTYNVKVDALLAQINPPAPPPPPVDDHADAGNWANATNLFTDPQTGNATQSGTIGSAGDSDLFRFVAAVAGVHGFSLGNLGAGTLRVRVYSAGGSLLTTLSAASSGQTPTYFLSASANQAFYFLVDATTFVAPSNYVLLVQGPVGGGGGSGGGGGGGGGDGGSGGGDDGGDGGGGDGGGGGGDDGGNDGGGGGGDGGGGSHPGVPGPGELAEPALPIMGTTLVDGRLGYAFLSAALRPMFAVRNNDGTWENVDILSVAGGLDASSRVVSWTDTRDGVTYVAASSSTGVLLFSQRIDGTWSARNLSADLGKPAITGPLTVYIEPNGRAHIAGLNHQGRLLDYRKLPRANDDGSSRWGFLNISNSHLRLRGKPMPTLRGDLVSFVTTNNTWNIAALDSQGRIHLFFKQRNLRWDVQNLSVLAGTPELVGTITAYQLPDRSISIVGAAANGNLWRTGVAPGGAWTSENISRGMANNRKPRGGGITSIVNDAGVPYIAGLNAAGRIILYRFNANSDRWVVTVPSNLAGGPSLAGPLSMMTGAGGASMSIAGQDSAGHVVRYFWSADGGWAFEDVSVALAA